jgi:general secretion pathway protein A
LLGAYAADRRHVDAATVRRAGREVRGAVAVEGRRKWLAWTIGLAALGIAAIGLAVLGLPRQISFPPYDRVVSAVSGGGRATPIALPGRDHPQAREAAALDASRKDPASPVAVGDNVAPAPTRLADRLSDPSVSGDDHAAFASLYSLWGLEYRRAGSGLGCDAVRAAGLECLFRFGNWNRLRRLDLPVILELAGPMGARRRVALITLGDERATLAIGGQEYTYPLSEIDRLWDGSFILIWKAPPIRSRLISRGMRGTDVAWLETRLDAWEGKMSTGRLASVYDAEMERRVVTFQRSRFLLPDGLVGEETLLHLTVATRQPGVPSLTSRVP